MNRRKEPCRNFQRGSCQYGDRCKFLHVNQQQSKPNNPFGFGGQTGSQFQNNTQQQQKPNPFGFGVQSNSQPKPFENKWSRFQSTNATNSTPARKDDKQPQTVDHKCTDPESCKRQIAIDFEQERPLWKLTCYGHGKNRPCDIVGDISYEELRAVAYDEAKRGVPLSSIVERERNLVNSKLLEFGNLLRNPYVISNTVTPGPNPFPSTNLNVPQPNNQNNAPPTVSSFSQLGYSPGLNISNPPPSNATFPQPSPFQIPAQNMGGGFGNNNFQFGTQGGQNPPQPVGSSAIFSNFNSGFGNTGNNPSALSSAGPVQFPRSQSNQSPFTSTVSMAGQASVGGTANVPEDSRIWLKEEWTRGEIPEEAPPDQYVW